MLQMSGTVLCCMPWGVNQESIPPTHTPLSDSVNLILSFKVFLLVLRVLIKSWSPAKKAATLIFKPPTSSENIHLVEMSKENIS